MPHLYRPHLGGIENYVHRLKNSLELRGHEVKVYTSDLSVRGTTERENGVFYCKTSFAPLRNPVSFELIRRLRESRADVYHLHSPWFVWSLFSAHALGERPKVMTVHSARIEGADLKTRVLGRLYRPLARRVLARMDALVALSTREATRLVQDFGIPPEKIEVIPNGIKVEDFERSGVPQKEFLGRHGLREDSFKLLYVGRMVEQKNQEKLVAAVSRHMKGENVEVILIGGGGPDYLAQLEKIADGRIHILGKVGFEELVAAYRSSDLFVFLGTWEGLPTVIMEAMLCGLPVLTTPAGGIPDLIEEGKNGLFVGLPVDERELADKISHFLDMSATDLEKMGRRNSEKIKRSYNWELIADRILKVYERVLGM